MSTLESDLAKAVAGHQRQFGGGMSGVYTRCSCDSTYYVKTDATDELHSEHVADVMAVVVATWLRRKSNLELVVAKAWLEEVGAVFPDEFESMHREAARQVLVALGEEAVR